MPLYQSTGSIIALYAGDTGIIATAEAIVLGTKSIQFAFAQNPDGSTPGVVIFGKFSGAPGAFSFVFQTADEDLEARYVAEPSIAPIVGVDANQAFRVELVPLKALFGRLAYNALANGVTFTGRITR